MKAFYPICIKVFLFLSFFIYGHISFAWGSEDDRNQLSMTITMTCPQDITVNCHGDVPIQDELTVTATSTCPGMVTVTFVSDVTINQVCPNRYKILRTYAASDPCLAQATCVQMITVHDNVAPAITCPSDIAVSCMSQVPAPNTGSVISIENCPGIAVITHLGDAIIPGACPNQFTIVRTYRATDACSNTSTCIQTILVNDNTGPLLINCPADLTVSSSGIPTPCSVYASILSPQVLDLCDPNVQLVNNFNFTTDASGVYPEGTTPVIWTATDACGNTSTCAFNVTVVCDVVAVCDPCDDIALTLTEYDTCCFAVDLSYVCGTPVFSKIDFDILTPGVYFGAQSLSPSWNYCGASSLTNICIKPATGLIQTGQYFNFFSFCLTNIDFFTPLPQSIKVTYWMVGSNGQDSIACDTTLLFYGDYCKKYCASVTHDNIHCLEDSMKYEITVSVQNIASPPFIAHHLSMIGPGLSPNPVPLIPPLPNDGSTRTVTFCYTPIPWPDPDGLLFLTYGLSSITGDTSCNGSPGLVDTLSLTACDTCLCLGYQNVNFYYSSGSGGWQAGVICDTTLIDTIPCIPPSGVYQFQGEYLCSDSCQATVDYEIWSVGLNASVLTGTTLASNIGNNTHYFNVVTGFQLISGHYQLILKGHCGSDYCRCVINFFIQDCYPLCPDNLVQNPKFELFNQCPTSISQIYQATFWSQPTWGTSDYYNSCTPWTNSAHVPNNQQGYQVPHSGVAYAGFILKDLNTYREYIETPLIFPLMPLKTYEISFYVSLAESSKLAIDKIGAYLSNGSVGPVSNSSPLNFVPQVSNLAGNHVTNKNGWTLITGTFTPASGSNYTHLVIGNFGNTATTVPVTGGNTNYAYYYIDDVSVCEIDTCMCTGFQDMTIYYNGSFVGWQLGFGCNTGAIDTLPCIPSGHLYQFKGKYSCSDSCLTSANYDIISGATGTSVQSGSLSLIPLGNNTSSFDLVTGFSFPAGNYQLIVEGHCGMDSCQCVIDFYIKACDTCACGSLDWAKVWGIGSGPKQVFCDSTALIIPCKKTSPGFFIEGDLRCQPDSCGDDTVFWKLDRPGTLTDVIGFSIATYPYFGITIPWSDFARAGGYTLTVSRYCGGKLCECKFNLVAMPCPCSCPVQKDANHGFTVTGSKNSCVRKFKPVKLCPTDMINWQVNGPGINNLIVGSSLGTNNFQMTFPTPGGTYDVCMIVKRIDPLSGDSCFGQFCQKVITKCKPGPKPKITSCSGGDRLRNGDFDEEFVVGRLEQGGRMPHWNVFPNTGEGIVLIDSSGASDDGHVVLIGGLNNFAGIYQEISLAGDSAYLGFYTINYLQDETPDGTQLEFRLQKEPIQGPGQVIWRHVLDTSFLSWVEVSIAIPIDIDPSFRFLVICVQNENENERSVVGIDNIEFCTDETVSADYHEALRAIRIFPNPNTGDFTVDLDMPTITGSQIRVIDFSGKVVATKTIEQNNPLQKLQLESIPSGMYFLQIIDDGRILSVARFVKM